jgi:hypothetical protein
MRVTNLLGRGFPHDIMVGERWEMAFPRYFFNKQFSYLENGRPTVNRRLMPLLNIANWILIWNEGIMLTWSCSTILNNKGYWRLKKKKITRLLFIKSSSRFHLILGKLVLDIRFLNSWDYYHQKMDFSISQGGLCLVVVIY